MLEFEVDRMLQELPGREWRMPYDGEWSEPIRLRIGDNNRSSSCPRGCAAWPPQYQQCGMSLGVGEQIRIKAVDHARYFARMTNQAAKRLARLGLDEVAWNHHAKVPAGAEHSYRALDKQGCKIDLLSARSMTAPPHTDSARAKHRDSIAVPEKWW